MADGFIISIDRGDEDKANMTIADAAPGTAGIEILVDHTKFLNTHDVARMLERAAELVREGNYPPA